MKIEITGTTLSVVSPYHPDFPAKAKRLGGKWKAPAWIFDARDEVRVRALCVAIYGTDGSPVAEGDLLTIRAPANVCDVKGGGAGGDLYLAGRLVARVFGRDSGAKLGDGVVCVSGGFSSGGSVKNYRITTQSGTVVEVRDVPRAAAEKVHAEYHGVTLLDATGAVVLEATVEPPPAEHLPVEAVATMAEIEIDRTAEIAAVDLDLAAAEGRLAGLRFRARELRAMV